MKIGVVSEFYYPLWGGVSEHIRAVGNALKERGHDVTVITSHMRGESNSLGPRVLRLGRSVPVRYNNSLSRFSLGWRLGGEMKALLEEEDFDVLHLHSPLQPTLTHLALRHARCPVVATFHSYYPRDMLVEAFQLPLRRLLRKVDIRVPVSAAALRPVERLFPGDYRIIPNGVDYDLFASADSLTLPGLEPGKLRILFVGAMVKRKGLPHLLEAFAQIGAERDDVELLVVGDGPGRRRVERSLSRKVRDRVHFLGPVTKRSKLAGYYASADIFCAPSLGRESFGMVLLEAMAAGLPVVGFDIEGYRDVVTHGRDGLLVQPGNARALGEALKYFIDSPESRRRYGERGRAKARDLDWNAIALRVEGVYRDVLGQPEALVDDKDSDEERLVVGV